MDHPKRKSFTFIRPLLVAALWYSALVAHAPLARAAQINLPGPAGSGQFGETVAVLPNGNFVVIDPSYDAPGPVVAVGAVYLYDGVTLAVISALIGSATGDRIGSGGVTVLSNTNFLVTSSSWNNGAGAVTWGSGTRGVSGTVSAANSLVGDKASDYFAGGGVRVLSNGNYVVISWDWNDRVGAVTWGSGTAGVSGTISAANSLIGTTAGDYIGDGGVTELKNGNYVVTSSYWNNGMGAVTWASGNVGVAGVVSAGNSLVGTAPADAVGNGGVTELSNGNYVVRSINWNNGSAINAGAVTFGSGTSGVSGAVSAANSLVGSNIGDQVGSKGVVALVNGNYVVASSGWHNGALVPVGAVTWGRGTIGVKGVVSAANSLIGSAIYDDVGANGVTALSNGNYVVKSPNWANGTATEAGAVTWGSGTTGVTGTVSSANSLVGTTTKDFVGTVVALDNGNYLVRSYSWNSYRGAVTWGSGTAGVKGAISSANSLVGSTPDDLVGAYGVSILANGNYVVGSPRWHNGNVVDAGAVTWGSGTVGVRGAISAANSLIGSQYRDQVGNVLVLNNGNYVVDSPYWSSGALVRAGAVTWANGTTGVNGAVSAGNSMVGGAADDEVGYSGLTALNNGNFVVSSKFWNQGAGAVTWGSGTTGLSGVVSAANSLVGSKGGDYVGGNGVTALGSGNYVVSSPSWDNGAAIDAGAVTWCIGTAAVTGAVSSVNSLVGSNVGDMIGLKDIVALDNGNFVASSPGWDNNGITDAGAVTWGSGTTGVNGVVSVMNSLIGNTADDQVGGSSDLVTTLTNGNYLVFTPRWDNAGVMDAGAVTLEDGLIGSHGGVGITNSVLGLVTDGANSMVFAYDYLNTRLLVGQPSGNRVSLFAYPTPLSHRWHDPQLNYLDAYQLILAGGTDGFQYAAYLNSGGKFHPALSVSETATGKVLAGTNALSESSDQFLLFFTNQPGQAYSLEVTSVEANGAGDYEIGFYPVIRPGAAVTNALSVSDPWRTNRYLGSGDGRWFGDDYLLRGVSPGESVILNLESAEFDSFLEVRLLNDESIVEFDDNNGGGVNSREVLVVEGGRDYLIRVTSSTNGGLGRYTLRVEQPRLPTVLGFTPASGVPGTQVRVRGNNFLTEGGASQVTVVRFGGAQGGILSDPTAGDESVVVEVPEGAVSGPIVVETFNGNAISPSNFVVLGRLGFVRGEAGGRISFGVTNGGSEMTLVVDAASNLNAPILWNPIATNLVITSGLWRYTNAPGNPPQQQFYRIRIE